MKTLTTLLIVSLSFINFASAADLECHAGLVGLGETFALTKVSKNAATAFSGGDKDVQFWALATEGELMLETTAVQSKQKTVQRGPALVTGQNITQIFQVNIDGANTAYFLTCEAQ